MDKLLLQQYIDEGKSIADISALVGKSKGSVRHHLAKHSLKTNPLVFRKNENGRYCSSCDSVKPDSEFYIVSSNGKNKTISRCKSCFNKSCGERQKDIKKQAVEYKGGKCIKCKYSKSLSALEFHHLDSSKKDFSFSRCKSRSFEKIKAELDKCILLCANCHREIHDELRESKERQ